MLRLESRMNTLANSIPPFLQGTTIQMWAAGTLRTAPDIDQMAIPPIAYRNNGQPILTFLAFVSRVRGNLSWLGVIVHCP